MSARLLNCTAKEYHADPSERPSLSASVAKTLILRSPLHAWSEHPKLGGMPKPQSEAMNQGNLVHAILLGEGQLCVIAADDFRTKAARELRDEAIANGQTPVLERTYTDAISVCAEIQRQLSDSDIDLTEETECSIEFEEASRHGPVLCRGRLDHVNLETGQIDELKTISSADLSTCERQAYRLGYDIQHCANVSAVSKLRPELAGRISYRFIFIEMDVHRREIRPPYVVVPRPVTGAFAELGERRWYRAVETWAECLASGEWPSYASYPLDVPGYAISLEEAEL